MKLPFVSRKKYNAMTGGMAEHIAELETRLMEKTTEINMEIRALREALFHRERAEQMEKLFLKQAAVQPKAHFIPESHNATPTQTKTAPEAEKGNETDS